MHICENPYPINLRRVIVNIVIFFFCITFLATPSSAEDKGGKGYWLARYGEIRPEADPLTHRAHDVFRKVLKASDRRKGLVPELIVINYSGKPWAQSLVDGTIILTKNALEFCYKDGNLNAGDSRLAFVIGHELAHQFNGDFWHYLFFQATKTEGKEKSKAFDEIREIVKDSDNFMVKELQADQYGIIYASIAGYDIDAVVSKDRNLFEEWAKVMNPSEVFKDTTKHPSPEQRGAAVMARLKDVTRRLALFRAGVVSYYTGLYKESIALMEEFARFYPSKEVYNNIGTANLSVAYKNYRLWKVDSAIPFKLSFGIDPYTQAESIEIGKVEQMEREAYFTAYVSAIEKAGEYLRRAIESGYDYVISKNNLGCTYILEGRFHEAVAILEEALIPKPDDKEILNNRGIAYYYLAERLKTPQLKERAEADFKKALSIDREFSAASYNLAVMGKGAGVDAVISSDDNNTEIKTGDFKKALFTGVQVGKPVPAEIKEAVKKGYIHKISVDGKNSVTILDLIERSMTVVERSGLVLMVMIRAEEVRKKVEELRQKGFTPDRKFNNGNREVWLFPSYGIGIEFMENKAVMIFLFTP